MCPMEATAQQTAAEQLLEVLVDRPMPLYVASLARPGNPTVPGTMGMQQDAVIAASRELAAAGMLRSEPCEGGGAKWYAA